MNEMQQMLNDEIPGYGNVIWTVLIGLAIGLGYGLLKRIILSPILIQCVSVRKNDNIAMLIVGCNHPCHTSDIDTSLETHVYLKDNLSFD